MASFLNKVTSQLENNYRATASSVSILLISNKRQISPLYSFLFILMHTVFLTDDGNALWWITHEKGSFI